MSPNSNTEPMLNRIGQVALAVTDLEASIAFYRDQLGMVFLFQAPNVAFFDCLGIRFMLGKAETEPFQPGSSVIYFTVEDIHSAHEALTTKGVNFKAKPHLVAKLPSREIWMAFFTDLDGNLLALMSEVLTLD